MGKTEAFIADTFFTGKTIHQGSSELNIIIGVANSDYEKCIKAIYNAFMG